MAYKEILIKISDDMYDEVNEATYNLVTNQPTLNLNISINQFKKKKTKETVDNISIKEKKDFDLTRAFVEAMNPLSLVEHKLFLYSLYCANSSNVDITEIRIYLVDFIKTSNVNRTYIYKSISQICDSLRNTSFQMKVDRMESRKEYRLFNKCQYKKGNGYIDICFNEEIKPFFLDFLNHFHKPDIEELFKFNSKYAIRIYQLLKISNRD